MATDEQIKLLISYDKESGHLNFRSATPDMFKDGAKSKEHNCAIWNAKNAGRPAFTAVHSEGYLCGTVLGRRLLAHRVAWFLATGCWPRGEVDHENHDRIDNRFKNLRDTTRSANSRNLGKATNNPSGVTGVYWFESTGRWVAKIQVKGRSIHLGYFTQFSDAVAARLNAQVKHGFHKNHGRAF